MKLFKKIESLCADLEKEFDHIPNKRKEELTELRRFFKNKFEANEVAKAIVICTHNSRRSHIGQLWLLIASEFYDLPKVESYSGGTEATAFNPRAVQAIKKAGLKVKTDNPYSSNPIYHIRWSRGMKPYLAFSKKYESAPNPKTDFGAIMVCNSADEACPIVQGASFRLPLPYEDPKAFDDTPLESEKYMERFQQIGRDILWMFSGLKL